MLVEEDAIAQAELSREIARLFPECPPARREEIAAHTAQRGSGRVGRTAAGRALEPEAITLAVVAAARHGDTDYDDLLMMGVERQDARDRARADVEQTLERWRGPADTLRGSTEDEVRVRRPLPEAAAKDVFDPSRCLSGTGTT